MSVTSSTTNRARDIFLQLLEQQPPDRWQDQLASACAGSQELEHEVRRLIIAHGQLNSFMGHQAAGPPATVDQRDAVYCAGTQIGAYKLLEQIGEGGMGLVYMAEQQQPVRRLVALKLVKPGMDTKQVIARFEAERQALAMMDHPNIAKVHDAGTTETGRPYFVMELVRGIPISEFCDQQKLNVRQRLELFIQVCQAIQHAHQKGIIHRDLKPTNVLVTKADTVPLPKVIDFGIAKALGPSLTDHTLHTGFAQLVGTPMYMSPEQAEMNHFGVDTRSDVYSLGVLLYELLTGTTPFDKETLSKAGLDEVRRMIREDDPPRPSARISTLNAQALSTISQQRNIEPQYITAALRGELDWIVMKALEKDRSRRYESSSSLAADIQRYLSDEPVLAFPPTAMYRFQKFARKHKPALATAAAIALCLLLGTTVSAWQAVRATTAEAQAAANEQEANANAKQAKEQAIEATAQRDEAQKQRDEVKALADKLAEKERQLQRSLYASNMNLAKSAWDAGNIRRVNRLLDQHRPQAGETDLRGFEWHYLYRMCHSELLTLQGHSLNSPAPHSVAFSPDGKRLANPAYGFTGTRAILVRDAQTGEAVLSIKGGRGYGVAFSPDGKRLAFGDYLSWDEAKKVYVDLEVKVCDAQTGQQLLSCKGHTSIVRCVAFSPDGKHLASSSSVRDDTQNTNVAGEVKIWDAQTGEELRSIKGHSYTVDSVAFSPDGLRLATASNDRTVKIWNAHTGQELLSLQDGGESVAFSGDGKRLASGGKVWDAETGKELLSVEGRPESVAFSPDGKRLVYSGGGVTVRDAQTGAELLSFKGHTTSVTSVVFSPDGTRVASGSRDNTVKVWDATTSQQRRSFGGATRVQSVTFSPDGKRVAFGVGGFFSKGPGEVKVSDSQTGQELNSLKGHTSIIRSVAYSPDGKRLASASSDKTVKLWNAETGQELLTFKGHTGEVVSVAFSPDSTRVASSISYPNEMSTPGRPGETGEVKVWDAANGQELLSLKGHSRFVNRVVFSPDGKRLATLSRDQTLRVWDAQSGHEIHTLKVRVSFAGDLAFSPDGKLLASSDVQPDPRGLGGVKVWDSLSGQELLAFDGHSTPVQSIAFSPDGKRFITGAGSPGAGRGEIKMWDALTGQELLNLDGSSGPSDDVAFSPEGYRLAGRGHDGTLTIWDATPLPEKP